jgi:hypothetical protein
MTFPAAAAVTQRRTVITGLAIGVTIGVAGTGAWWYWRRQQRIALLKQLAVHFDNEGLDPEKHGIENVVREIQLTFNLPGEGKWNDETEAKVRELLAGPKQAAQENPPQPPADPRAELEPDGNWEATYAERLDGAVGEAMLEPQVVTFDQAVLYVLTVVFPDSGRFHDNPNMGSWKRGARERTRQDLAGRLGHTEAEARAVLNAQTVGTAAVRRGLGLGQAVREMGQYAFPTARWEGPRSGWQTLFSQRAAAELQAANPSAT